MTTIHSVPFEKRYAALRCHELLRRYDRVLGITKVDLQDRVSGSFYNRKTKQEETVFFFVVTVHGTKPAIERATAMIEMFKAGFACGRYEGSL